MSGSGPLGPILNGVWQSLQLMIVTRYLPRSTCLIWTFDWPALDFSPAFVCAWLDSDVARITRHAPAAIAAHAFPKFDALICCSSSFRMRKFRQVYESAFPGAT